MSTKAEYLGFIEAAYEREKGCFEEEFTRGLGQVKNPQPLFGYIPPRWMLDFGATCAFLFTYNYQLHFAEQAKNALFFYREWLKYLPAGAAQERPEYSEGMAPLEPVFYPVIFVPAVECIRDTLSSSELEILVGILADSLRPIWRFPEWGGHNRAMLRAAGLALSASAFPEHAEANLWATMADELAEESWGRWSIEDTMLYQAHWLRALVIYAEARDRVQVLKDMIQPRMHLKAITQLVSPLGILPDYGDSHWLMHSHWEWAACLEWGARAYRDQAMKWTADRIFRGRQADIPDAYLATVAALAWMWCDESLPEATPVNQDDALDDLAIKKKVWRTGWGHMDTYACMNYRDEGDYGRVARDYLRNTLAVSAEKMHHGHADEGSFVMLVHNGTLLLHESGYRENPPDGIYRSAMYHNRLAWRAGQRAENEGLLEFMRGDGRYLPVRTERLYQTHLGDVEFTRIRTTDEAGGLVWDRSMIFIPDLPSWLVIDIVLATRTSQRTISALWWTTDILAQGEDWYLTHIRSIQDWKNNQNSALMISIPSIPNQSSLRSVEPFRRSFQDELALAHTWTGEHQAGEYIKFVTLLSPQPYNDQNQPFPESIEVLESEPQGRGIGIWLHRGEDHRLYGTLQNLSVGVGQENVRPTYTAQLGATGYGPIISDAAFIAYRINPREEWAGFINGTFLACHNRALYEGPAHAMFQENRTARPGVPARFRWETAIPRD